MFFGVGFQLRDRHLNFLGLFSKKKTFLPKDAPTHGKKASATVLFAHPGGTVAHVCEPPYTARCGTAIMLEFQRFDEMTCAVVGKLYLATERRSFLGFCAALAAGPVHAAVIGNPVKTRTLEVIGDSQAQGLAAGLHRAARGARSAHVLNDAKPGTGLVAPSIFDWPAAVPGLLKAAHPDVAVLMFGANDCMSIRLENGHAVAFGTSTWTDKYRQRATAIARAVKASGARLIWVGNPIARDATYSKNMQVVNAIFADVVSREGGTFIDTWLTVSDGSGNYAGYGRNLAGATERLRLDDGIHFTPSGYDIIAARVMSSLQDTQLASTQK